MEKYSVMYFVWKWGPRPQTSSRCYHGNKSAAPFKKSIFVHPPWAPNCMQNLKGGWKFSFPKMFDSYRDLFLTSIYPRWIMCTIGGLGRNIGRQSTDILVDYRSIVAPGCKGEKRGSVTYKTDRSTDSRPMHRPICRDQLPVKYRSNIGQASVKHRSSIGQASVKYRPSIGQV